MSYLRTPASAGELIDQCHAVANQVAKEFSSNFIGQVGRPLTECEKFCIAVASGVKVESSWPTDSASPIVQIKTEPACISWNGSKFVIATMAAEAEKKSNSKPWCSRRDERAQHAANIQFNSRINLNWQYKRAEEESTVVLQCYKNAYNTSRADLLKELEGVRATLSRRQLSDDACDRPFDEDIADAIKTLDKIFGESK